MGKKIYKITESQMKSILENKKSSKNDTKEQISEDQLKNIFESLADKVEEYDNYNYPAGADADPSAPWNDDGGSTRQGEYVKGDIVGVGYDGDEMLLMDKSSGKYYYTINEAITDGKYDIYDELSDFLDIPQEEDEDEDGRYMVAINDWKSYIDQGELLGAMASYLNNSNDIDSGDQEAYENGDVWFMEVSPESIEGIGSDKLKSMVKFN